MPTVSKMETVQKKLSYSVFRTTILKKKRHHGQSGGELDKSKELKGYKNDTL